MILLAGCGRVGYDGAGLTSADGGSALPDASAALDAQLADGGLDGRADARPADPLVSSGLVARYFLDDDSSRVLPSSLGGDGLAVAEASPGDPTLDTTPRRAGLVFPTAGSDARACVPIAGSSFTRLDGSTSATLEAVVDITEGVFESSRIVHFGGNDMLWGFSLAYNSGDQIGFAMNNTGLLHGRWMAPLRTMGRVVLTLVYDGSLPEAQRVTLHIDGALQTSIAAEEPAPAAIDWTGSTDLCLGNRVIGQRSPRGTIHYAAIYDRALSEAEIVTNVERLLASDDR